MVGHDIIVIGTSAGGVETLKQLVADLPSDLPAAIFIVLHISPHATSVLPQILQRAGKLPAFHPHDGQAFELGSIYIAPPDHHMLVKSGHIKLTKGPRENGHRPSVDVLFRTAARAYGSRVVGVVLSGVLDDGSAGLVAVKSQGGLALVQDPNDAMYSPMPRNALEAVDADYVAPVAQMGKLLVQVAQQEVEEMNVTDGENAVDVSELDNGGHQIQEVGGKPSLLVCPECGGVLSEFEEGDLLRFRCHVGHAYSAESLMAHQAEALEEAIWVALRTLEDNAIFALRMAKRAADSGHTAMKERYEERALEAEERAVILRKILLNQDSPFNGHDRVK